GLLSLSLLFILHTFIDIPWKTLNVIIMTPDDNLNDIVQRPPEICVDYLSHEWNKEDDIWTSWRVMSKQKNGISNGIHSDVTWLYGPLHTAWHSEYEKNREKSQVTEFNLMPSTRHKSCLKKKSISETLRPRGRVHLVVSNSDTQLYKNHCDKRDYDSDVSDCDTSSTCSSISGPSTPISGPTRSSMLPTVTEDPSGHQQHIRFNDQVEQCIAVESADEDDDHYDSNNDSSSDDGLEMKISLKKKKKKDCSTICKLAPTKLKSDTINYSVYSSSKRHSTTSSSKSTYNMGMFDFDTTPSYIIPPIPATQLNHSGSGIIPRSQGDSEQSLKQESSDQGIIVKAVHIAHNVREIVNWCSSM
ncbi:9174_t:CDS:2, partial [Scutellospora calospora]